MLDGIAGEFAGLVDPIWRRIRPPSRLAVLLRDYPPYLKPHPGDPWKLSEAEQQANLDHFLRTRPERLARIVALLAEFGLDAGPALDPAANAGDFLAALDVWARQEWPKIPGIGPMTHQLHRDEARYDASQRPLSMLLDVATLLGDYVALRRSNYGWALDHDKASKRLKTASWGRVVMFRPALIEPRWPAEAWRVDEEMLFHAHEYHDKRFAESLVSKRGIHQSALEHAEGRHDPPAGSKKGEGNDVG